MIMNSMGTLRRDWLPEAILLFAIAVGVTILFAVTPLDIDTVRVFYRTDGSDHWPLGKLWPWSVLYKLAPFITASLLILGLVGLLIGYLRSRETWRENSIFLIFLIVIGPGLIINAVFKDHWDRPRPRDVVQFGGALDYTPAPWRGEGGGSFPCGHCSVGFLYSSGWWIWKRRRPVLARASLALGLIVGSALGLGRMAAGAHFVSDVIWSALLALGLAHFLFHHVLRPGERHDANRGAWISQWVWLRGRRLITVLASLGAVFVLLALFVTPHGKAFSKHVDLAMLPQAPRLLEVRAPTANIDIIIADFQKPRMDVQGELHGFGLPGSRLDTSMAFHALPIPTLSYRIEEQGWITDLSASATIRVAPGDLQRISVRLHRGNIRVTDTTRSDVVYSGALQLDLHTDSGHVQQPEYVGPSM